jgi:hypothetical protein
MQHVSRSARAWSEEKVIYEWQRFLWMSFATENARVTMLDKALHGDAKVCEASRCKATHPLLTNLLLFQIESILRRTCLQPHHLSDTLSKKNHRGGQVTNAMNVVYLHWLVGMWRSQYAFRKDLLNCNLH